MTAEDVLLVPSAVLVPDELKFDLGPIPTGMIPIDGRPALDHIGERYNEYDPDMYVAGREAIDRLDAHLSQSAHDWTLLEVQDTSSLGETLAQSLRAIADMRPVADATLYVNFADTIVSPVGHNVATDSISYAKNDYAYRWTSFTSDRNRRISSVTEKFTTVFDKPREVFTGQFKFTDAAAFCSALEAAGDRESETDQFYLALQEYLDGREYELLEAETWRDIGHLDTYYRNKRLSLNVREFNEVDVTTNTIRKTSDNTEALRAEIEWYEKLPQKLRPYVPQVYDYSKSRSDPYVTMEYVGYPTLSDIYMYGTHGLHLWSNVYDALFDILDRFGEYRFESADADIEDALWRMYYRKTVDRLDRVRGDAKLKPFFGEEIIINGEPYPAVNAILNDLETVLSKSSLLNLEYLTVVHGDLCFPNVLFDVRNNIPKLIDPRGEFGPYAIYGDYRYDLAKLRHSVAGHYEFIINDKFDVTVDADDCAVSYGTFSDDVHDRRKSLFDEQLARRYPGDVSDVQLLESLLFLSMVPLHGDIVRRQQCMLATGIEKFAAARD
ncbi:MAG: hypothetical protein RI560_09040 [Natronomonas sp.]|nr:hypothetical protein [Natronomonas sp.]